MVKFGVDVGGTTIKIGLFEAEGELIEKYEIPTDKTDSGSHIIDDITDKLKEILSERQMTLEQCQGVGVGLPGPVDAEGNILECVNLGWGIFPVEKEISGRLNGIIVKAGNDANVAALGEQSAGAGAGKKNFVMVTLGTGVGGGIIVNGKILEGTNGAAGEIGHIPVNTE
jgi:glucokinase